MSDRQIELILKLRDMATAKLGGLKSKLGGLAAGAGRAIAAGIAVGATALAAATAAMLKLGSDAVEAENVTQLAFGSMSDQVGAWAAKYQDATGLSRYETTALASDMGLLVSGMGFTKQEAFATSTRMVELAADMASAKNVPLAEALEKIRAGLVGEAEPLRTMGVLLSAARVEQVAYAEGIAETGAKLTEQQKVRARELIILQDSVAMHKDATNTATSAANAMKGFWGRIKDAATELGKAMQPALEAFLATGNDLARDLDAWAKQTAEYISAWLKDGGLRQIKEDLEVLRRAAQVAGRLTVDSLRGIANGVDQTIAFFKTFKLVLLGPGGAVPSTTEFSKTVEASVPHVNLLAAGGIDMTNAVKPIPPILREATAELKAFAAITPSVQLSADAVERLDWRYQGLAGTVEGMAPRVQLTKSMVDALGASASSNIVKVDQLTDELVGLEDMQRESNDALEAGAGKWTNWQNLATGAIGAVASSVGGLAGQLMNIGQQLLSGNWVGAIMGGVGLLVNKIKGLFGGPSEEELQGRAAYDQFSQRMRTEFADNERYVNEVRTAMALGQSESIAHAKAAFQVVAEASGRAWDDGSRLHDQYLNAIETGNVQLMAQAESTFQKWREEAGLAGETMTEDFDQFFTGVTAVQAPKLTEAMIEMFGKAKEAGAEFAVAMEDVFQRVGEAWGIVYNDLMDHLVRENSIWAQSETKALSYAKMMEGVFQRIQNAINAIPRSIETVHTTIQRTVHEGVGYTPKSPGGAPPPAPRDRTVVQPVLLVDDVTDAVLRRTPAIVDLHGG